MVPMLFFTLANARQLCAACSNVGRRTDQKMKSIPHSMLPVAASVAFVLFGAVPTAQAVRINAEGLGQALIYPYYTVRSTTGGNAYVTALAITNSSSKPKALKVRLLEGKAGAEVLDFNLFLAAYDMWTAAIV